MATTAAQRIFIDQIGEMVPGDVRLQGWIYRLRVLGKTAFIILRDCTGEAQCVIASDALKDHHLKVEDVVEIEGSVRAEPRSKAGFEVDISEIRVLNRAAQNLPFQSAVRVEAVGLETLVQYRPLALRTESVGDTFRVQAALLGAFRDALNRRRFTEIVTSKIVGGGTEGGTNLFEIKYFDRVAYLAQSPQFYKEHGVAGFERVYETAHVYRAEPHASSRHLTEYYSLDVEFGFIDGPEDVIQLERELLTDMFENLNRQYGRVIKKYRGSPSVHAAGPLLGVRRLPGNAARRFRPPRIWSTILIPKPSASSANAPAGRPVFPRCLSWAFHWRLGRFTPRREDQRRGEQFRSLVPGHRNHHRRPAPASPAIWRRPCVHAPSIPRISKATSPCSTWECRRMVDSPSDSNASRVR